MKRVIEVFRLLNAPCKDMTALASRAMDTDLPFWPRFAYKFHLLYCHACRRYLKQLRLLRGGLRRLRHELSDERRRSAAALSADARERIARSLRGEHGG